MTETFEIVPFYADKLLVAELDGKRYLAITPICNAIGIDPRRQRERIIADDILAEGGVYLNDTTPLGGMQQYFCLRLDLVHGWLFGINVNRVAPAARNIVRRYKKECFRVLYDHFTKHKVTRRTKKALPFIPDPGEQPAWHRVRVKMSHERTDRYDIELGYAGRSESETVIVPYCRHTLLAFEYSRPKIEMRPSIDMERVNGEWVEYKSNHVPRDYINGRWQVLLPPPSPPHSAPEDN